MANATGRGEIEQAGGEREREREGGRERESKRARERERLVVNLNWCIQLSIAVGQK